jgi:hypothetical protein
MMNNKLDLILYISILFEFHFKSELLVWALRRGNEKRERGNKKLDIKDKRK